VKSSKFTEEQIVAILRKQEAGMATTDVRRKHGISAHVPQVEVQVCVSACNKGCDSLLMQLAGVMTLVQERSRRHAKVEAFIAGTAGFHGVEHRDVGGLGAHHSSVEGTGERLPWLRSEIVAHP
jgi:hypothetical protein